MLFSGMLKKLIRQVRNERSAEAYISVCWGIKGRENDAG